MKSKSIVIISSILLLLFSGILIYIIKDIYPNEPFNTLNDVITLAVTILSFIISGIALVISVNTYFSIDAVNTLSSMEGNVLCNENYTAEYLTLVSNFKECKTDAELEQKLFETLNKDFDQKSNTCMQFTDRLQDFIDHLLWYAYVSTDTDEYKKHIDTMMASIDEKYEKISSISNGNQYILKEHIKLIKNVLKYQATSDDAETINGFELLNIRGNLFTNAVSKTIYYDYLGLEFRNRAIELLKNNISHEGKFDIFSLENMPKYADYIENAPSEEITELTIYLQKAREAFEQAETSSRNDILWKGYISFNKARLDIFESIMNNSFKDDWDFSIQDAINARLTVLKLLAPKDDNSYLYLQFKNELYYAKSLYLIAKAYHFRDDDENFQDVVEEAKSLLHEIDYLPHEIFELPIKYLENIIKYKKVES